MIQILSYGISFYTNNHIRIVQSVAINIHIYIMYGNHDLLRYLTITLNQAFKEYI